MMPVAENFLILIIGGNLGYSFVVDVASRDVQTSEVKELLGVVVRDVLDHLLYTRHLTCRDLTLLHVGSDKVAEYATEILVAGVRYKGTAVGQHSDERT